MIDNGPPPDTIDSVVTKKEIIMDDYDLMLDEYDRWNEAGDFLYEHWLRETDEGMDLINERNRNEVQESFYQILFRSSIK